MEHEERFGDVLAAYLEAVDAGWAPPREQLLRRYPQFADELREFFGNSDGIETAMGSLRAVTLQSADDGRNGIATLADPAVAAPLIPGRSLNDYEILKEVARGGMGVVYKAKQRSLNRDVALKMVLAGRFASADSLQRFRNEAEAVARLDHPNIVPVYEVGDHEGQPFFTMKFIEGGSLAAELARPGAGRVGPRRLQWAAQLLGTVARAVHHAHQRGILHRDLKPGNILLDRDGQPHVTDFGLAKRIAVEGGLTQSNAVLGTPNYMLPEQALAGKKPLTVAADVYALGAILYELLTDSPPFQGDTPMETLQRVLHEQPLRPRNVNPSVNRDLELICLKCLEKDAARRYTTAEELADDLARWQRGEPVHARTMGWGGRLYRWVGRNPMAAALAAMSLVAILLLAALMLGWNHTMQLYRAQQEASRQQHRAEEQETLARRYLYTTDMNLAQTAWAEAQVPRVLQLLEAHQGPPSGSEDVRGFEWHYLSRLAHGDLQTLRGHTDAVTSVAFSADGSRLASASDDQTVKVWDVRQGREALTLQGHTDKVVSVAFSPDGTRLATASSDRTAKLWDAQSGKLLLTLEGHKQPVSFVAFSPNGASLTSASGDLAKPGELKVWDAQTGQPMQRLTAPALQPTTVTFSLDGSRLASVGLDRQLKLWDTQTGKETLSLKGHSNSVTTLAFSPDGNRLASAGGDQTVKLWDTRTGQLDRALVAPANGVTSVTFSPDGKRLAVAGEDQTVKVWDVPTGKDAFTLKGHTGRVTAVTFRPDGKQLASGSSDHTIKLWDTRSAQEYLPLQGNSGRAHSVVFSPDSRRFAVAGDRGVKVWDARTSKGVLSLGTGSQRFSSVAFSPDEALLAGAAEKGIMVWDARTGQEMHTLGTPGGAACVAFSLDGGRLFSGGPDGLIKVWDTRTGMPLYVLRGHTTGVASVAFSPDGTRLASAAGNVLRPNTPGEVKVWELGTNREVRNIPQTTAVVCVAFSPDGTQLAGGGMDQMVRLWDAKTGAEMHAMKGHTNTVRTVAFSPDGKRLASGSGDRTVKLWDALTGQEVLGLKGHQQAVSSVAFSPDGNRLVSCSWDETVRVWDATSHHPEQ